MVGYSIFQLGQFDAVTRSILHVDNQIVEIQKKLMDSLLSQMRYESKYIIIRDETLHRQFLLAREEFQSYMEQVLALADAPPEKKLLARVKADFASYQSLSRRS
jgi:hypothetical protein